MDRAAAPETDEFESGGKRHKRKYPTSTLYQTGVLCHRAFTRILKAPGFVIYVFLR
jgi:hypothetical protein